VVATEQVSLFGLIIVEGRTVTYGNIAPAEASDIFIQGALVEERVQRPFAFMTHNRRLIDRIRRMEDKFRRRDLLVSDAEIFAFYRDRIPKTIADVRTFSRFLKKKGGDGFLRRSEQDLLQQPPDTEALAMYPDRIDLGGRRLDLDYRFSPGRAEDGVTVRIPAAEAADVPTEPLDWLVPGMLREKIDALIRGLPKVYRRHLVPVADTIEIVLREMPVADGPLVSALGEFLYRRFGLQIPASAWPTESLADHLKMRIAVVGPAGEELRAGRDRGVLTGGGGEVRHDALEKARTRWERTGIEEWDIGDLPEEIDLSPGKSATWTVFPALVEENASVGLRLFTVRSEALAAHRSGVAALYRKCYAKDLKFFRRQITLPAPTARKAAVLGGAARLEEQIFEKTFNALFAKNIRTAEAFRFHRERAAASLFEQGQQLVAAAGPVVEAVAETRSILADLERENARRPKILALLEELRGELSALVPVHFIGLYAVSRMAHLPRYVKALSIRARRGIEHLEKDRTKAEAVHPFRQGLAELLGSLSPSSSDEKRDAVEDFFWMLEEYKVSVFAQELGTAAPVSRKKLEKHLGKVRRMA
jgi:ATP-dependent helicase HrpA